MENAKVYKIINDIDDKIYVGSSTYYRLCERMNVHRHHAKDESGRRNSKLYLFMREIGISHFKIELIEKYECKTSQELKEREQHWIDELKPELNMFRAIENPNYEKECRNKEERNKKCNEYYHLNKEIILEQMKEYREKNKELISEKKKIYREANKDKIALKKAEKITCECGKIITKSHLSRHKLSHVI